MAWVLLLLVLVAAAFGVLSAVLKLTVIVVLTILFSIVALLAIGVFVFRHQARRIRRELERHFPRS